MIRLSGSHATTMGECEIAGFQRDSHRSVRLETIVASELLVGVAQLHIGMFVLQSPSSTLDILFPLR